MKVLVTGANRGIGLELVRQLRSRGDDVIAVCRKASEELKATGAEVISGVDVTADDAGESIKKEIGQTQLDALINNAGILSGDTLGKIDFDLIRKQFEVNSIGPLRITEALRGSLGKGARVAVVTSRMGSIGDNGSGGYYGYRMSKAAVNIAFVSLARDLAGDGIFVGIFHPGMVATEMTGRNGIAPAEAAAGIIARLDGLNADTTGRFFHQNGEELPW